MRLQTMKLAPTTGLEPALSFDPGSQPGASTTSASSGAGLEGFEPSYHALTVRRFAYQPQTNVVLLSYPALPREESNLWTLEPKSSCRRQRSTGDQLRTGCPTSGIRHTAGQTPRAGPSWASWNRTNGGKGQNLAGLPTDHRPIGVRAPKPDDCEILIAPSG